MSSLSPQSAYTPYIQAIKSNKSTFARNGSDYVCNVFFRKEAQVQGVNTVKVWDCSLQCYDSALPLDRRCRGREPLHVVVVPAVRGQGSQRRARQLPSVRQEARRVRCAGVGGGRGVRDGRERRRRQERAERPDPCRAARRRSAASTNFDANGFVAPTNIGGKVASNCLIGMQVQNGKFVRVDPVEPGKFDCSGNAGHDHDGPGQGVQGMSAQAVARDQVGFGGRCRAGVVEALDLVALEGVESFAPARRSRRLRRRLGSRARARGR